MKNFFTMLFAILTVVLLITACGQKHKPVEIQGLTDYSDPAVGFSIKHPTNWWVNKTQGVNFGVYSSRESAGRFNNYDSKGLPAARIFVSFITLNDSMTIDDVKKKAMIFQSSAYKPEQKITIDGVEGSKYLYEFELEDGKFNGELFIATKDAKLATIMNVEAFAGSIETYRKSFDEIIASLKLAVAPEKKIDTIKQIVEIDPPSENLTPRKGTGYTISIPDNFRSRTITGRNTIFTENYIGERRADCNIQVDVKDASKQKDLKKIVTETKGNIGGAGEPVSTTIGGEKGYYIPYSIKTKDGTVKARMYFAMKGDRLFQITMNWFSGEEQNYLPIFEKSIASVKFE